MTVFEELYDNDLTGAPAYDPAILLKVVLLAYSRGIVSSREIAKACEENIIFMALSADQQPHFTTIASFITKMKAQVLSVFTDVLLYCDQIGLIGKNMFAIDGCKMPSNASKEWSGTHKSLKRKKDKMTKALKFLLDKHRKADDDDDEPGIREQEEKYINTIKRHIEKIDKFLADTDDKIGKTGKPINSNITDNDSAKMKTSHGVIQGYDGVVAVDDKDQIIIHAQAFGQAQEHDLLKPMIDGVRDKFKAIGHIGDAFEKAALTVDAGFHSEKNVKMVYSDGIDGYIADKQFRKRDPKFASVQKYKKRHHQERGAKKTFSSTDFKFVDDLSFSICPAGQRLYRNGGNIFTKGKHNVRFKGPKSSCLPCKLRNKCLRHPQRTDTRTVAYFTGKTEGANVNYTQLMKEKIDSEIGRSIYSRRIGTVEPVFANIRHTLRLCRFTLRGAPKVNIQWNLYSIIHNMLKVHRRGFIFDSG
jgi:transposase